MIGEKAVVLLRYHKINHLAKFNASQKYYVSNLSEKFRVRYHAGQGKLGLGLKCLYLIDLKAAVIVDAEATRAILM